MRMTDEAAGGEAAAVRGATSSGCPTTISQPPECDGRVEVTGREDALEECSPAKWFILFLEGL